jgi:hypothetical protein
MQTECSAERSMFGRVEGRSVVAEFDGGALTLVSFLSRQALGSRFFMRFQAAPVSGGTVLDDRALQTQAECGHVAPSRAFLIAFLVSASASPSRSACAARVAL